MTIFVHDIRPVLSTNRRGSLKLAQTTALEAMTSYGKHVSSCEHPSEMHDSGF